MDNEISISFYNEKDPSCGMPLTKYRVTTNITGKVELMTIYEIYDNYANTTLISQSDNRKVNEIYETHERYRERYDKSFKKPHYYIGFDTELQTNPPQYYVFNNDTKNEEIMSIITLYDRFANTNLIDKGTNKILLSKYAKIEPYRHRFDKRYKPHKHCCSCM